MERLSRRRDWGFEKAMISLRIIRVKSGISKDSWGSGSGVGTGP